MPDLCTCTSGEEDNDQYEHQDETIPEGWIEEVSNRARQEEVNEGHSNRSPSRSPERDDNWGQEEHPKLKTLPGEDENIPEGWTEMDVQPDTVCASNRSSLYEVKYGHSNRSPKVIPEGGDWGQEEHPELKTLTGEDEHTAVVDSIGRMEDAYISTYANTDQDTEGGEERRARAPGSTQPPRDANIIHGVRKQNRIEEIIMKRKTG